MALESRQPSNFSRYCPATSHIIGHVHISENMATLHPDPMAFTIFMDMVTTTFTTAVVNSIASPFSHAWLRCIYVPPYAINFRHTRLPSEHKLSSEFVATWHIIATHRKSHIPRAGRCGVLESVVFGYMTWTVISGGVNLVKRGDEMAKLNVATGPSCHLHLCRRAFCDFYNTWHLRGWHAGTNNVQKGQLLRVVPLAGHSCDYFALNQLSTRAFAFSESAIRNYTLPTYQHMHATWIDTRHLHVFYRT